MIILDCEQYSEIWWLARLGILTGSAVNDVVTPTGKKSSTWTKTQSRLVAERVLGRLDKDEYISDSMKRGHVVEIEARAAYELFTGNKVIEIGLAYMDENKDCAFSADGLIQNVMSPGGLEIKCPEPQTHIAYWEENVVPSVYRPQVYGSLYMSGYDWWDFMSYHPELPEVLVRTTKEDAAYVKYRDALDEHLQDYLEGINTLEEKLRRSME